MSDLWLDLIKAIDKCSQVIRDMTSTIRELRREAVEREIKRLQNGGS